MTVLYIIIAFIIGFLLAWFIKNAAEAKAQQENAVIKKEKEFFADNNYALKTQVEDMQSQLRFISSEAAAKDAGMKAEMNISKQLLENYKALEERLHDANHIINSLDKQKAQLDAELKYKNEQLANQKTELEGIGKKFEAEFKVLAQNILNEKTEAFNKHQEKSLIDILKPLKENIDTFKTEIGSRYDAESKERISLKEQIKLITETNRLLGDQANNLTNALRGQVKQQGNWGEMILESILEHSGLTKDIHYFVQERVQDEEGAAYLPDIVVKYPDGRSIVVDSKVSLNHYEAYSNCRDATEQDACLQQLLRSVYAHINRLSSKDYQQKVQALDFVMLFVPVEGAYITAMQNDTALWRHAYNKKVLLISPTNLIPAMKLVYDLWKKDDISKEAHVIAGRAVKIYEKLAAFVEDFEKVGAQLQKATAVFNDAQKKLHTGRGSVIAQASNMKVMQKHNKPTRKLPAHLVEQALVEDEMGEDMNDE